MNDATGLNVYCSHWREGFFNNTLALLSTRLFTLTGVRAREGLSADFFSRDAFFEVLLEVLLEVLHDFSPPRTDLLRGVKVLVFRDFLAS